MSTKRGRAETDGSAGAGSADATASAHEASGGARRVLPRNLTARAAYAVAGNPATSRPEDAVANCYPGLELDVRNLDRRFFPGLVFDFVARDDKFSPYTQPMLYGALLRFVDTMDPALAEDSEAEDDELARRLLDDLQGDAGAALSEHAWYLDWVEQGGKRISMWRSDDEGPLDGLFVWRIVRGLQPLRRSPSDPKLPVTIGLARRHARLGAAGDCSGEEGDRSGEEGASRAGRVANSVDTVTLRGWRRRFSDERSGVISLAYVPGEMQQSLCSPWQHDFRDCGCHYWAANHPDVVLGEVLPGEPVLPDEAARNPVQSNILLDWLRAERAPGLEAAALNYVGRNRPFQIDHYQINHLWQDLAVVIDDTEIGTFFAPRSEVPANPFATPDELAAALRERLAPLEMVLALEYLYARFSVVEPEQASGSGRPTLRDDVTFFRHLLLLTATSEMTHLRWANQLLWELYQAGLVSEPPYEPVLHPARFVPAPQRPGAEHAAGAPGRPPGPGWRWRARQLRPLSLEALDDFVAIEHPEAAIDVSYQRVYATLRRPEYPSHLAEIAQHVLKDGNDHYERFLDIRRVITTTYGSAEQPYLRTVHEGTPQQAHQALEAYESIRQHLRRAYADDAKDDVARSGPLVVAARSSMNDLLQLGEQLAAAGIGIPFWGTE